MSKKEIDDILSFGFNNSLKKDNKSEFKFPDGDPEGTARPGDFSDPEGTGRAGDYMDAEGTERAGDFGDPEGTGRAGDYMDTEGTGRARDDGDPEGTGHPEDNAGQTFAGVTSFCGSYTIGGKKYTFVRAITNGTTGEADVALVACGGKNFALKIYRKKSKPNMRILNGVKDLNASGLLVPLYNFGLLQIGSEQQAFELMEYMSSKSLVDFPLNKNEELLERIALNAAKCINFCHSHHILHKDIKPANFFVTDATKCSLVLADFGISDVIDENGYSYSLQSGTTTYNAPEMYKAARNKVRLTSKSDFYSLGILLMSIWMGERKFRDEMGDKPGQDREFDLLGRKMSCDLPYPEEGSISEKMWMLMHGLTIPDENKRWGYQEILKWSRNEMSLAEAIVTDSKFVFDESKNKVANSPEELADFIWDDPKYAIKLIRRGKISQWLHECKRDRMATFVDETADEMKNDDMCVIRTAYILNPNLSYCYQGVDKMWQCDSLEEIADIMFEMDSSDEEFMLEESNLSSWLLAHGYEEEYKEIRRIVSMKFGDPRWPIAYTLNPDVPYRTRNKKVYEANTLSEVVDIYHKWGCVIFKEDAEVLCSEYFLDWVRERSDKVHSKILAEMSGGNIQDNAWCIIYNLDLRCSYELALTPQVGACHKTIEEIGELANDKAIIYYCKNASKSNDDECREAENFIYNLVRMKNNRIYYYLHSKGCFEGHIKWLRDCFDITSPTNKNKCTPYYESYAVWKAIKEMIGKNKNPRYSFPKSGKVISSPSELSGVSKNEIADAYANRFLLPWISTFYQENPFVTMSGGVFERKAAQMLETVGKYYPQAPYYERYDFARKQVNDGYKGAKGKLIMSKILVYGGVALYLASSVLLSLLMFKYGVNIANNPLEDCLSWFVGVGAVLGLIVYFFGDIDGSWFWTVVSGAIAGVILYYPLYWGILYILKYLPYIISAILLLYAWLMVRDCYRKTALGVYSSNLKQLKSDSQQIVQPLYFAFKSSENTYSFKGENDVYYAKEAAKDARKSVLIKALPSIAFVGLLLWLFTLITPALGGKDLSVKEVQITLADVSGTWVGKFNGDQSAGMEIYTSEGNEGKVLMSVKFKKWINEDFKSLLKPDRNLVLTDVVANGKLDGTFNGTLDESMSTYTGTYTSRRSGKTYEFEFKKKQE